jgi:beta-lactamase class A
MSKKIHIVILAIVAFVVGTVIGYGIEYYVSWQQTKSLVAHILPVRENNFNYQFIYPLLRYDFGNARYFLEDKTLEEQINNYVQQQYRAKNASSISVYFSSFLKGQWAGVNADTQYYPGSLMKVLIMMDYYRQKQLDPLVMEKTLTYSQDIDQQVHQVAYSTPTNLILGQNYTVEYLVSDMIENSDDGAATLLLANDNREVLTSLYRDLKMSAPGDKPDFTISVRDYTVFLRILYNSTYLTEVNSEAALSTMSKSTYKDGISAGVPADVVVAQKYGEDIDINPQGNQVTGIELHNCGIVYAKVTPYTICVMTKSNGVVDQKQLASIIKGISNIVYHYVNSNSDSAK